MNRRQIIWGIGGGAALIGSGSAWSVTRPAAAARVPWALGEPVADVRLDALRHAILAPNPHNRQPWLLRLDGDDGVTVSCDLDKRLPETDPFDRQTVIGFGTFCELARIAASTRGRQVDIVPFPDGVPGARLDARPVARLRFIADPALRPDPLSAAIGARRSNKAAYDDRRVAAADLDALRGLATAGVAVAASTDPVMLEPVRAAIVDAYTIETRTPRTYLESVRLMRIGRAEIDAAPDGIDLGGPVIESLRLAGLFDRAQVGDPASAAFAQGLDMQRAIYGSVPAAVWLTTPDDSRAAQFACGRAYVRLNLLATRLGLSMHPTSQGLQEYPEMAATYARLHDLLGARDGARVQMLARLGHGPAADPAPRWPLTAHLV